MPAPILSVFAILFLTSTVDAGFTSDVVICATESQKGVREIRLMLFQSKDRILVSVALRPLRSGCQSMNNSARHIFCASL